MLYGLYLISSMLFLALLEVFQEWSEKAWSRQDVVKFSPNV